MHCEEKNTVHKLGTDTIILRGIDMAAGGMHIKMVIVLIITENKTMCGIMSKKSVMSGITTRFIGINKVLMC